MKIAVTYENAEVFQHFGHIFINNKLEYEENKKCDHHNCSKDKGGCSGNK